MTLLAKLAAAITFYTTLPVPPWVGGMNFQQVARLAPLVGVFIGGGLGLLDAGLNWLGMPVLVRSALIVITWVAVTGGLHLDGAMDSADGLAVTDPQRRLQAMADSLTGAFGSMVAIALLLLKTLALGELNHLRWLALILAAGWGRWGQQVAIVRYPYLKPTGKGAFHKAALRSWVDLIPSGLMLFGLSLMPSLQNGRLVTGLSTAVCGGAIALLTAAWFNRQFGGHTGDTYGAVVEWTEALLLVLITILW